MTLGLSQKVVHLHRTLDSVGLDHAFLACADLAVFKAFFARPKDALDIATMASVGSIDLDELGATVADLLGRSEREVFLARVAAIVDEL